MAYDAVKEELKDRLPEYVNMITKPDPQHHKDKFCCPLCGSGTHGRRDSDGDFTIYKDEDGWKWKCYACGESGDIFDLIGKVEGLNSFPEQKQKAADLFHVDLQNKPAGRPERHETKPAGQTYQKTEKSRKTQNRPLQGQIKNFSEYFNQCAGHIDDPQAKAYLDARGVSHGLALVYNIGFDPAKKEIIIPCSNHYYVARSIDPEAKRRYDNPAGVSAELFNTAVLYETGEPVFIVEGAFDALAVRGAGGKAVALNSTANYRRLIDTLREKPTPNTLILSLDNDEAGRKASADLADGLREINTRYVIRNISGDHKDPDEAMTADTEGFLEAVQTAERQTGQPDNVADYIRQAMAGEIEDLKQDAKRQTGFDNLDDEAGSLYSGLYVIGGISSVGKTSFAGQMADQLAAAGNHVLYFSMEQSRLEMVSKSISRRTAMIAGGHGDTSLAIRTGRGDSIARTAAKEYLEAVGDRLSVIECNLGYTVALIENYTKDYIAATGAVPVIIVDYLQVLDAAADPATGRKPSDLRAAVNDNVTALKRLSRALETPVIVLSSVNRSNYLAPLDFESFKESGSIEFTADVVWGLQLTAIHEELFTKEKDTVKKRERLAEAKEEIPREIELVCLKNRYGKSRYSCTFTYRPDLDYFEPTKAAAVSADNQADADGFMPVTDIQESIFDM